MWQRCSNPGHEKYYLYGARGIRVCKEWADFDRFYAFILSLLPPGSTDMPPGISIDREDNDGNYEPGNVRLADRFQQASNTRRNRLITIGGETKCMSEWRRIYGTSTCCFYARLAKGYSDAEAMTAPRRITKRRAQ